MINVWNKSFIVYKLSKENHWKFGIYHYHDYYNEYLSRENNL